MTTAFLPLVSTAAAAFGAAAELFQLVADVSLLLLGVRLASAILDTLARLAAALRYAAEATLLVLALVLSVVGDLAPLVGRALGTGAGKAYVAGRQARRLWDRYAAPAVSAALATLDRQARIHITQQLGNAYPRLTALVAFVPSEAPEAAAAAVPATEARKPLTRRQLLILAREARLTGYSRKTTAELRALLTAA